MLILLKEDILPQYDGNKINSPGENPYELLKGYIDPENNVKFKITYNGRSASGKQSPKVFDSIKLTNAIYGNNGYITLVGQSRRRGEVEATILQQHFLGVMTGAMSALRSLKVNGVEIERKFDTNYALKDEMDTQYRNYYILLQDFNYVKLKKAQRALKDDLIEVYNNLDDSKKQFIQSKVANFKYQEEQLIQNGKKGRPDSYSSVEKMLSLLPDMKMYPVGNSKVSRDTLLVNITSAVDCPSYKIRANSPEHAKRSNTCLAGEACYAMASENQYINTKRRNRVLNIVNLICLYGNRMDLIKGIISEYIDSAREAGFNIRNIRINENGDFIDQKCVNEYSRICGEIQQERGVQATAYTAKTRDYSGNPIDYTSTHNNNGTPPNIVLTVSRADKSSVTPATYIPEEGFVDKTAIGQADRFFLAIPEEMFKQLPDTPVLEKGQPNLASNPTFKTDINPNGKFHKCQCEIDKGKVCGDCQICYTPNTTGEKYFIFCKLHGNEADKFNNNAVSKVRGFDDSNFDPNNTTAPKDAQEYTKDVDDQLRKDSGFNMNNPNNWYQNNKLYTKNTRMVSERIKLNESIIRNIIRKTMNRIFNK